MGLTYAEITLVNSYDATALTKGVIKEEDVHKMTVSALVDSGAYMLTINETMKVQLGLSVKETREIILADGSISECEIVGPVDVRFKNRMTSCLAVTLPGADEVLLGAIPMEDLDVIIDPKSQELLVNPLRPYVAGTKIK